MNIENKYPIMVFRNEYQGKKLYNIGLSKKDQDGNYINGSISCRFKKDVVLENQTKINIKSAWLDFYKKDKETVPYIFINEFETVGEANNKQKVEKKEPEKENDPFADVYSEYGKQADDNFLD